MNKITVKRVSQRTIYGAAYAAIDEDGVKIADHFCSNDSWALEDLGVTTDCKHDIYSKRYPDGYEVVWEG